MAEKEEKISAETKVDTNTGAEKTAPPTETKDAALVDDKPADPTTPITTVPAQESQEKSVKKSFLEKFKLGKKAELPTTEPDLVPQAGETQSAEVMAEALYRQLNEVKKNEYLLFRLKKRSFIFILSIFILMMWLVVGTKALVELKAPRFAFWNPDLQERLVQEITLSPSPTPDIKIRVRNNLNATASAQALVTLLADNGFPGAELVDDPDSEYQGLMVVTKPEDIELRQKLETVLSQLYAVSSPSAELTQDSDFRAVVLFGKNATAAGTLIGEPTPSLTQTPTATPTRMSTASATLSP